MLGKPQEYPAYSANEFPRCKCGERKLPYSVFFVTGPHDQYMCPKCGPKP